MKLLIVEVVLLIAAAVLAIIAVWAMIFRGFDIIPCFMVFILVMLLISRIPKVIHDYRGLKLSVKK